MASKENNFTLGTRGINLVDEPLALEDGDLQNAQNAEFRRIQGRLAIGKRGGLARLNGTDLGGTVLGGANIPLPSPLSSTLSRAYHAALGTADADTWDRSTDGTTWADVTSPARAAVRTKATDVSLAYLNQRCVSFQRRLIYFGNDYTQYPAASHTAPPVRIYDGVTDAEICRIPFNPDSGATTNSYLGLDMVVHKNRVYLSVFDPGGAAPDHRGRVFSLNLETGALTQVGNRFTTGMPFSLCTHNGLLWAGTYGIAGLGTGRIYSINVDTDTTWTLRHETAAGSGYITSMVSFGGVLYFTTSGDAGSDASVRTLANDYSTAAESDTGPTTTGLHYYAGLAVYDEELYATFIDGGAGATSHIRKFDGSAWSTDLDVDAAQTIRHVGQPFVDTFNDSLLIPFIAGSDSAENGYIYRKASGSWTAVETGANLRGFLGRVDTL